MKLRGSKQFKIIIIFYFIFNIIMAFLTVRKLLPVSYTFRIALINYIGLFIILVWRFYPKK